MKGAAEIQALVRRIKLKRWLRGLERPPAGTHCVDDEGVLRGVVNELVSNPSAIDDRELAERVEDLVKSAPEGDVADRVEALLFASPGAELTPSEQLTAAAQVAEVAIRELELTGSDTEARALSHRVANLLEVLMRLAYENELDLPESLAAYQVDADQPDAAWRLYSRFRRK